MPLLTFHQIVDGSVMNIWRYIILYQLISLKILMEFFYSTYKMQTKKF